MTGRRVALRLLGTTSLVVGVVLAVAPASSQAEAPAVVGWWHRDVPLSDDSTSSAAVVAQSTGAPVVASLASAPHGASQVPPPPELPPTPLPTIPPDVTVPDPGTPIPTPSPAPEGGLLVAGDVSGIRAMAALRFDLPDAGGAVLRLVPAAGSTPTPGIQACPALSDWQPGPDQPWADRPAHDCERLSVSSTRTTDGTALEWTLPDTFKNPDSPFYDVLLLPVGGDGTPFQVAFEKPGSDSFEVTSPAPPPPGPEVPPPLPDDLPPPIESFSPDGFDLGSPGFDGPSLADPEPETVGISPATRRLTDPRPGVLRALENPTTRRIAALALMAIGAYAYWQSDRSLQRAPRLLGALGGGAVTAVPARLGRPRGIGRFARPRTGPASRL